MKFIHYAPFKIELQTANGFIITDEKGYKFYFLSSQANTGTSQVDAYDYAVLGGTRTWNLEKIVTPNNDEVVFQYANDVVYQVNNTSRSFSFGPDIEQLVNGGEYVCKTRSGWGELSYSASTVVQSILKSISFKGRTVNFNTITRNDIQSIFNSVPHALSSIQITNENNKLVKSVQFTYNNNARLRLDKVSILDNVTNVPVQNYNFDYYNSYGDVSTIPLITSANRTYGFDWWGYYNAAAQNLPWEIPNVDYSKAISGLTGPVGQNQRIPGVQSITGMLRRITYPTGGYTEMEYESNQAVYDSYASVPPFLSASNQPAYTAIVDKTAKCFDSNGGFVQGSFVLNEETTFDIWWAFTKNTTVENEYN